MEQTNAQRVRDFSEQVVGDDFPTKPTPPSREALRLRAQLIFEEFLESMRAVDTLLEASPEGRMAALAHLAHELTDLLYVTYGAILACGVDPDAVFAEVHAANMRKGGGERREDGKLLKPLGWQPADVAAVIQLLAEEKE